MQEDYRRTIAARIVSPQVTASDRHSQLHTGMLSRDKALDRGWRNPPGWRSRRNAYTGEHLSANRVVMSAVVDLAGVGVVARLPVTGLVTMARACRAISTFSQAVLEDDWEGPWV